MKKLSNLSIAFSLLLMPFLAFGATSTVNSISALSSAAASANPGDVINLADGTYNGVTLTLSKSGSSGNLITIKALNGGMAKLRGNIRIRITGNYIKFSGFDFEGAKISIEHLIEVTGDHNIVEDLFVKNVSNGSKSHRYVYWPSQATHNTVKNCWFEKGTQVGISVFQYLASGSGTYNTIDGCFFKSARPSGSPNGNETVRFGTGMKNDRVKANAKVLNCLFENADGEGEIISMKASDNLIDGNTFINCQGSLTLRHYHNTTVSNNFFLTTDGSDGNNLTLWGDDHDIINNYFSNVGDDETEGGAIRLNDGEGTGLSEKYEACENITIKDNIIYNAKSGRHAIALGDNRSYRNVAPKNVNIVGNYIYKNSNDAQIHYTGNPSNVSYSGNKIWKVAGINSSGISETNPNLVADSYGVYRKDGKGPNGNPLNRDDVGPIWMRSGGGNPTPPSVSITQPTNGQTFNVGSTVVVNADASDEGSVTNVKLYLNGTFVRQESTAPYDWSHTADLDPQLKNMAAGTYTLKAIAEDNTGLTAETSISFIVNPSGGGTCILPWSTGNISVTQRTENYSSGVIDISECGNVEISMDLQGVGPMETSDYCNVYYKLNGGSQVAISENTNAFALKTVSATVSGNTVELIIIAYTSYSDETYTISNISISEESGPVVISNLALNKPTTASSTPEPANGPANAVDRNTSTRWSATGFPQWLEVDLGEVKSISKTELVCYADRAYQFVVEAKTTSTGSYTQIVNRSSNTQGGSVANPITDNFTAVNARYVRITVSGASGYTGTWTSLQEFRVFGATMKSTIKNSLSQSEVNVFPNPFYDMLLVDLGAREFSMLRLVDISGRTLLTKDISGLETTGLDISSEAGVLNTGIYYIVLEGASDIQSIKVFKSH